MPVITAMKGGWADPVQGAPVIAQGDESLLGVLDLVRSKLHFDRSSPVGGLFEDRIYFQSGVVAR